MFAVAVISIVVFVSLSLSSAADQTNTIARKYSAQLTTASTAQLSVDLQNYRRQSGGYPASLTSMAQTAGFEHLRGEIAPWHSYQLATGLNDSRFLFDRAAILAGTKAKYSNISDFLAANSCGTGGFTVATSWCPTANVRLTAASQESRADVAGEIAAQRLRMVRTLQRLSVFYNAYRTFPAGDYAGTAISLGTTYSLPAIAGFSGTAANCGGTFQISFLPLGCDDLFDVWGGPVNYRLVSTGNVQLIASAPIKDATGSGILIGQELDSGQ